MRVCCRVLHGREGPAEGGVRCTWGPGYAERGECARRIEGGATPGAGLCSDGACPRVRVHARRAVRRGARRAEQRACDGVQWLARVLALG